MKLIEPALKTWPTTTRHEPLNGQTVTYSVCSARVGDNGGPPLTAERVVGPELLQALIQAKRLFSVLRVIEEAYDVLMGNYLDLEDTVLRLCSRELAQRHNYGRSDHFDTARRACHRALANLLSSARAFDDQSCAAISALFGNGSAELAEHKAAFNRAYDASLGYRVMAGLRNHAQHQGLSVSGVSFGRRIAPGGDTRREIWVTPYIALDDLRQSPKVKAALVREVERWLCERSPDGQDTFSIIPFTRAYVSGLATVIASARERFAAGEAEAEATICSAFYQYTGFFAQGSDVSLEIVEAHDGHPSASAYYGSSRLIAARRLREINGLLPDLPRSTIVQ